MNIFNSSIICIAYLCLIVVEFNNNLILRIMALIDNSFLIITLCYSCDIIPERINKFSDEIQKILSLNKNYSSYSDLNQHLIQIKIRMSG
jgi:hypothetical protein